jgi:hypothetical protein
MSHFVHAQGVPLLVSPQLLRSKGLGQIDLAIFHKQQLNIYEVKKTLPTIFSGPNTVQRRRLLRTQKFLAEIFKCPTHLVWIDENFCKS